MSDAKAKAAAPAAKKTPSFTPVLIFGIIADCLVVIPIILYMVTSNKTNGYNKYHSTMINMLVSAWMPMAITWLIAVAADSKMARAALGASAQMAGMGPFALQWVGMMVFIMSAHSAGKLGMWENMFFTFLYLAMNIGMVIMHYFLNAGVQDWIQNAPIKTAAKAAPAKPAPKKKAAASNAEW